MYKSSMGCMDTNTFHVYPLDDLIGHITTGNSCPCGPRSEAVEREDGSYGWLLVHHSLDGREEHENG